MRGVIVCTKATPSGAPLALTRIGGISILERQIRILRQYEVREIRVISSFPGEEIRSECLRLRALGMDITVWDIQPDTPPTQGLSLGDDAPWYLCDGLSVYDYSMPRAIPAGEGTSILAIPTRSHSDGEHAGGMQIKQGENAYYFAGLARVTTAQLAQMKPEAGQAWLEAFLSSILESEPDSLVDLAATSHYDYDMRRDETFMWVPIQGPQDNPKAKRMLLNRAQKSVLDWPAWYIHRPVEKAITYHLCEHPITPNQITLFNILVAFAGIAAFATGYHLTGLILALAAGIIDGLDGKQARVKVMMSKVGKLEEVSDRVYEYGWYLAIAYWLVQIGDYGVIPYILFAALFVMHGLDVLVGYLFKLAHNVQLDDFGPLERRFRLIGSRRNTNMWTLIPFVIWSALYAGLWTITVYFALTVAFRIWRLIVHMPNVDGRRAV